MTSVSDVTGFPEMMDGRVKTLHPAVHGGILARRHRPDDLAAIAAQGIRPVDLVVVNLYPFAKAAANPETPFDDLVEEIDIGGPSLVRAAAKNFRDVLVVVDPADYPRVLEELDRAGGPSLEFRFELMRKAFEHTGAYDMTIATTLLTVDVNDGAMTRRAPLQDRMASSRALRYGENPHQKAYWQVIPESMGRTWQVHQGKELSYTNLLDLDAAVRIALEFSEPAGVVIKHTNPCGVATGASAAEAYVRAREADPLSAFGGIVGLNRALDGETATALTVDVHRGGDRAGGGGRGEGDSGEEGEHARGHRRLRRRWPSRCRSATSRGALVPRRHAPRRSAIASTRRASRGRTAISRRSSRSARRPNEWTALRFAWRVCAHVKSNAVIFTGGRSHARRRRRADEPRRRGEGGGAEGRRGCAAGSRSRRPTRSSRSATASTRSPPPAPPRSCSPAGRCATPR